MLIAGVNHSTPWFDHKTYSNRQSPSRDIATSFAIIDYLRYIVSGGQFGQLEQRLVKVHHALIIVHVLWYNHARLQMW